MKFLITVSIFCLLLWGCFNTGKSVESEDNSKNIQNQVYDSLTIFCNEFNSLNDKIRDSKISADNALNQIKKIIPKIKSEYYKSGGKDFSEKDWCFPVQGYNSISIGGKNGNGYIASNYNYFDGNKHIGHPAQDIFIFDNNQDCKDDKTNRYVNILSMTGGVVIAFDSVWDETGTLRGGKYIWIYEPAVQSFFYYAHNNNVLVKPGTIVKPGDIIGTVGRTGMNANKKRSPTHLHFMQLTLDNNFYPRPYNCYQDLLKAKVTK